MNYSDQERKILRDNKSGSSEILDSVLNYNLQYINENGPTPNSLSHLLKFNRDVDKKFSAMAIVTSGLKSANQIISESISENKSKTTVLNKLERLIKEITKIDRKIIKNSSVLFPNEKNKIVIATYSNSGLVKKVIKYYRKKIKKIYLSEARPAGEGKEMAQFIADVGIEVELSVDALLPSLLSKVDLLLLGADSVGEDRFINKIGSDLLLHSARRRRVKSAILFESLKIRKINIDMILRKNYSSQEIWPGGGRHNIGVINQYFEIINNRKADRFISDLGVDTPRSLNKRIKAKNIL